ncbi:hypothetical protein [Bacillus sp. CDB3]|uniref:hypothetical protein n=1 Tax=Bacillus sp. CDB3 TaxID=360310 RepID=UPI0009D81B4B|nr:hypothetical protein [Bacillus sp. CDB3]OQR53452.1 hypothetical protein CDB3_29640 [Bacillus sp. CDB3]
MLKLKKQVSIFLGCILCVTLIGCHSDKKSINKQSDLKNTTYQKEDATNKRNFYQAKPLSFPNDAAQNATNWMQKPEVSQKVHDFIKSTGKSCAPNVAKVGPHIMNQTSPDAIFLELTKSPASVLVSCESPRTHEFIRDLKIDNPIFPMITH